MLIVFSGLPGTGKSTVSCLLARRLRATHLRVDTIEQALRSSATLPAGVFAEGYSVAYAVAEDNLLSGCTVVADAVNPLPATRDAWVEVANRAVAPIVEVEIVCSDALEHRRRVETRSSDIPDLKLPTWNDVLTRCYCPWERPRKILDTALSSAEDLVSELLSMPMLRAARY